ncbi:uncharacterized protein NDAI_0E04180 [Naumovozyma dairenensis CBS 421]|uniref:Ubiquitin carboxyl-terminal hydrolase n=1 Tax=Naumovozyma dairenensis (strain ATCC 10597 / BCRC 20456 / CBS 421 / NBRC 0211 / NRRL Y-12639) TaxID=1071378 RepID=G0WBW5_NAUDC|nr:hypothetical protein NDAI_0E04180 [Naumovozyma dairenensis CBS 421]CCD25235.1 hypothetical protein NDAI_0E04180 [Naumovozyma dairenensis CBS 421]
MTMLRRWFSKGDRKKSKAALKDGAISENVTAVELLEPLEGSEYAMEPQESAVDTTVEENQCLTQQLEERPDEQDDTDESVNQLSFQTSTTNKVKHLQQMQKQHLDANSNNETTFHYDVSNEESANEDMDKNKFSSILSTMTDDYIPFGDGSNKIFGYENFGNTCYCNSVLQCLYHLDDFKLNLLKTSLRSSSLPECSFLEDSPRMRKLEMPGNIPKHFTEASFVDNSKITCTCKNNNNSGKIRKNSDEKIGGKTKTMFRSFIKKTDNNPNNSNNNDTNTKKVPCTVHKNINAMKPIQNSAPNLTTHTNFTKLDTRIQHTISETPTGMTQQQRKPSLVQGLSLNVRSNTNNVILGRPIDKKKLSNSFPSSSPTTTKNPSSNNAFSNNLEKKLEMAETLPDIVEISMSGNFKTDIFQENQNLQTNGQQVNQCSPPRYLTIEEKKKNALINGPILNIDHLLDNNNNKTRDSNLYNGLKDIFECIIENKFLTGVVSPTEFVQLLKKENVLFDTMMHQDAHEFFNFLINQLSDYIQTDCANPQDDNFINESFQGILTNRIKCLSCDNVTSRDEPFLDFPIEVQEHKEFTDISTILKSYHQKEMLGGHNKFYCSQCCTLQEAQRTVGLKKLPNTLALHLKRFKYSEEHFTNIKLFNKIVYPLELNVSSSFTSSISKKYKLQGIVVHMGSSPQQGHYVAICKTDKYGWLLFDDETASWINEEEVLSFIGDEKSQNTAYVLFYEEVKDENDTISTSSSVTSGKRNKMYEDNIRQVIEYDDLMRLSSKKFSWQKLISGSSTNGMEDLLNPGNILNTKTASPRRKSRLFSFRKNHND